MNPAVTIANILQRRDTGLGGSDPINSIITDPPESEVLKTDDDEILTMDE